MVYKIGGGPGGGSALQALDVGIHWKFLFFYIREGEVQEGEGSGSGRIRAWRIPFEFPLRLFGLSNALFFGLFFVTSFFIDFQLKLKMPRPIKPRKNIGFLKVLRS